MIFLLATWCQAQQPTTVAITQTLSKGDVVFTVPDGWRFDGKTTDDHLAKLTRSAPEAAMAVNVVQQPQSLSNSDADAMAQHVCKMIRDHATAGDFQLIDPPKAEKDDRFFMRIHHKFQKNATVGDELQIYRLLGNNLITVAVTVFTDSPDEAKPVFEDAEQTLISVKSSKSAAAMHGATRTMKPATRPTALANAKVTFNAPAGWDEQINDHSEGIVATYHDPAQSFNTIAISVTPLPPEAKKDPKIRDMLVETIVNDEKTQFKFDGASVVGDSETVKDNRFLKKTRIRYDKSGDKIQVTGRQRRVGDVVVSVAMASEESSAADVDRLADEVAMSVRAEGR